MSNTSKILLNKVTDEVVIELLKAVLPVLEAAGIDYFVVGAFARDVELLAKGHSNPPARKTKDIDLAVLVGSIEEYEALKASLAALPELEESLAEPYRFIFRGAFEIDFLPFGSIADEKGRVELKAKKTFVLEMPGFDAVQPFAETIETEEGIKLKVSSLAGVVLLKLLAWQDRPERHKDIHDIDHILKSFMTLHWEKISAEPDDIFELYQAETAVFEQCVSARYIGRQMNLMLQNDAPLKERITQLLHKNLDGLAMARLMSPENMEESQRIIQALLDGMNDKTTNA
ncbi:MAG: nucleotidyl transferase AbiEii/AbiGii toxin family protein [Saprospiraceae bacterium]